MEIRAWARPFGVVIAPTESCQTLTPEAAERLAGELIRCAYDSRKLSPRPPITGLQPSKPMAPTSNGAQKSIVASPICMVLWRTAAVAFEKKDQKYASKG